MPRHDEPYMQPYRDPRDEDLDQQRDGACERCFADLGRADPMCPACGTEDETLHAA